MWEFTVNFTPRLLLILFVLAPTTAPSPAPPAPQPAYVPPYKAAEVAFKGEAPHAQGFLDQIRGQYLYSIPATLVGFFFFHKCFPLFTGEFDKLFSKIRRWLSENCRIV